MARHRVGALSDFPEGQVKVVRILGERVGVCKVGGHLYAFEDRCSHDDGPLGEGRLVGCEVECPRHGARFDIRDGRVTRPPAYAGIETYPVCVAEDQVEIDLPE